MAAKCANYECSSYTTLKGYLDSKEESSIQTFANELSSLPRFCNLIIYSSNAHEGTPFTDATITLKVILETWHAMRTNYADGIPKFGLVRTKDILKISVFDKFGNDGIKGLEHCDTFTQKSFLALLEFLHNKDYHEKAIQTAIQSTSTIGCKDTNIKVALAQHLFSQLIPSKEYEIDNLAKQIPKYCDCGCKANIPKGNTIVGASGTWHGRVDILLNQTLAVTIPGRKRNKKEDDDEDDQDSDRDEPPFKQMKVNDCEDESILLEHKVMNQILAQGITNGFALVNMHSTTLSGFLIPTFGATPEHVTICLYDPENDYLLHIKEELGLWSGGAPEKLHIPTVFVIWLFLNFTSLTQRKLQDLIDLDKSGLHDQLKGYLRDYRNATRCEAIVSGSSAKVWKDIPGKEKKCKEKV